MGIKSFIVKAFIIIIFFSLYGCASYQQIKDMEVNDSYSVKNIEAKELSNCVWELMKEDRFSPYTYHNSYDPIRGKWFIVAEQHNGWGAPVGTYSFSISFHDTADQHTLIEIRSFKKIWGITHAPKKDIFQRVKRCQECLQ